MNNKKDVLIDLIVKLENNFYSEVKNILNHGEIFYYIGFFQEDGNIDFFFRDKNPSAGTPLLKASFSLNYFKDRNCDEIFNDVLATLDFEIAKILS